MTESDKKQRFLRIYANLPLAVRNEVVCVLPQRGPVTWNAAYLEVSNETEVSQIILQKLDELNII